MDLSGAYISDSILSSNAYVYSDCSGENTIPLSNSNVLERNPPPDTNEDDRLLGLFRQHEPASELRNRNPTFECPVQQDSSEDADDEEDEEVSQEQVNQMRVYLQARSPFITKEQVFLYSVQLLNFMWNFVVNSLEFTQKVSTGVYSAFQPETYYFFRDSAHPWDARRINLNRAGSPHVDWYYNADTRTFSREENDGRLHHFPYLTAEIYHGDLALYDITSFTDSLKWTGGDSAPSANHVLSAWSLKSGILLDPSLPLVLKVINEEGEGGTIPLHTPTAAQVAAAST